MPHFLFFDLDGDGTFDMGIVDGRDFAVWQAAAKGGTDVAMEEVILAVGKIAEDLGITFPDYYASDEGGSMITFPDYYLINEPEVLGDDGAGQNIVITFPDYYLLNEPEIIGDDDAQGRFVITFPDYYDRNEPEIISDGFVFITFPDYYTPAENEPEVLGKGIPDAVAITFPDFYDSPPVVFVFDDGPGEPEEIIDGYW
ncbi:MAG: hypothetical protein AAGB15_08740 [Pseudomonadota bacterium]